jgi:superfamily II DNA or RNA helicase
VESHLKLLVGNSSTTLSDKLRGEVYEEFKQWLGYEPEDAMWRQQNNPHFKGYITTVCYDEGWCKCAVKKKGMHFPTGLVSRAAEFLQSHGIHYEIVDQRPIWTPNEVDLRLTDTLLDDNGVPYKFNLYDYQQDAVEKAVQRQRGIIKIATGGGKTKTAAGIIVALGVKPTIFYVTSMDLLMQAARDIEEVVRLNGSPVKVGKIGGGHKTIGDITVMTVQTAIRAVGEKYVKNKDDDEPDEDDKTDITDIKKELYDLIHDAKLIICDEVQHWRAETCQVIADHSVSCRWRYGLSATPWRDAGDDILIDACFGKPIVDISASWLISNGYLVKPYITFVPIKNLQGEKFGPYAATYKAGIVDNPYRTEWISRLGQSLVEQGRTVLVLVQQIVHGETIQEAIPDSVFLHGKSGKKNRASHIKAMQSGKAPITIASTIFDEGIDVRPLDALILAGGGKSPTRALQRIGRVIRKFNYPDGRKKKDAFVYDLHDHLKYLSSHAAARKRIYRSEPEFDIREFKL